MSEDEFNRLSSIAVALHRDGKLKEAGGVYWQIVHRFGLVPGVLNMLSLVEMNVGDPMKAISLMAVAFSSAPELPGIQQTFETLKQRILFLAEDQVENGTVAADMLRALLTIAPGDHTVLCSLATTVTRCGQGQQALPLLERASAALRGASNEKAAAEYLYRFFFNFAHVQPVRLVLIGMLAGVFRRGEDKQVGVWLGTLLSMDERHSQAYDYLLLHRDIEPAGQAKHDVYRAKMALARHYREVGKLTAAEACLRQALAIDMVSERDDAISELAEVVRLLGRVGEADELSNYLTLRKEGAGLESGGIDMDRLRLDEMPQVRRSLSPRQKVSRWVEIDRSASLTDIARRTVLSGLPLPPRRISRSAEGLTLGSCFAHNVANSLRRLGIGVYWLAVHEDINTTFATRLFLEWICHGVTDENSRWMEHAYGDAKESIVRYLRESSFIILTVGVAPVTFRAGTRDYVFLSSTRGAEKGVLEGKVDIRTSTVAENTANIRRTLELVRSLNPDAPIFLTLSPVPLAGTVEFASTMLADTLSKGVLRVAIHEAMEESPAGVYYWPSFEIIRWIGSHVDRAMYGDHDSRHPNRWVIDEIMAMFVECCCEV